MALSTLDQIGGALSSVGGLARAGRNLFDSARGRDTSGLAFDPTYVRETTAELDRRASEQLRQIEEAFARVSGLTGTATSDAVQSYLDRFASTTGEMTDRGRRELASFDPNLSAQTQRLVGSIDQTLNQYSLLNRPGFMGVATAPPTVKVDPGAITSIQHYDYSDALEGMQKRMQAPGFQPTYSV